MKKSKLNWGIILISFIAVLLIIGTDIITGMIIKKQTQTRNIEFLKEYSIALNNIHKSLNDINIGVINYERVQEYIQSKEYYYDFASPLYDISKEYLIDAKTSLAKAKKRLENIRDNAPDDFFKEDIENRFEQIEKLTQTVNTYYELVNYFHKSLYELNRGSKSKSNEYHNKGNELVPQINIELKELSRISDKIDLFWNEDWYPTIVNG